LEKQITVLGSTGSIGTQTLDVAKNLNYEVFGLSAYSKVDVIQKQIEEFSPKVVAITNEEAAYELKNRLDRKANAPLLLIGDKAAEELAGLKGSNILLNAIVGIAGLNPTLSAINSGKDIALANKESLVTGGKLVLDAIENNNVKLLPVDSEHSAIFQCLQGTPSKSTLSKIYLTASGGPFFGYTKEKLKNVTKQDALKHPNWDMGAKITIDSATMMNKGLEFIEAMWLFNLKPQQIEILVHRQSIVHSMVEFLDNAILAQLGTPDMRIPIQYALTWPNRVYCNSEPLDFMKINALTFDKADETVFECLSACMLAVKKGGLYPCIANGSNEAAVQLFLNDEISFLDIGKYVLGAVSDLDLSSMQYTLENIFEADKLAREYVYKKCKN